MRRSGLFIVLAACGALVFLLMGFLGDDAGRDRSRAGRGDEAVETSISGGARGSEPSKSDSASAPVLDVEDRDPNRIPGPEVSLRGIVLFGTAPAEGAWVRIHRATPRVPESQRYGYVAPLFVAPRLPIAETRADADGRFRISCARRTSLRLTVEYAGAYAAGATILVPSEGDPDEIRIVLEPGSDLRGRVVDAEGAPVAEATVRATGTGATVNTDEAGDFLMPVSGGPWFPIAVEAEGYPVVQRSVQVPFRGTLLVTLRTGGAVVGTVTRAGAPVAGAVVALNVTSPEGVWGTGQATADAEGRYRIERMIPGSVEGATISVPGGVPLQTLRGEIDPPRALVRSGSESTVDFRLPPVETVRGIAVRESDGAPVAGATILLARLVGQSLNNTVAVDAGRDGRFEFPGVPPGSYALQAEAPGLVRFLQRWNNQQQVMTLDFEIEPGKVVPEQRVLLAPAGRVEGLVLDLPSVRPAQVNVNIGSGVGRQQSTIADHLGQFRFDPVPVAQGLVAHSWNPAGKSEPFDVVAGQTTNVTLRVGQNAALAGAVADPDGRPLQGAYVRLIQPNNAAHEIAQYVEQMPWNAARTGEDGRYALTVQEWQRQNQGGAGWIVAASHRDHATALERDVKLPPEGQTVELSFRLGRGLAVSGSVTWEGGEVAAGVSVWLHPSRSQPSKSEELHLGRLMTAMSDVGGQFSFAGVASGSYTLSASTVEGTAESQQIEAGAEGVTLRLNRRESIGGFVVDSNDRGVPGARVQAHDAAQKFRVVGSASTMPSGRFLVYGLPRGAYRVEVSPGHPQGYYVGAKVVSFEKSTVDDVRTGTDDLVVRVGSGGSISGRVLTADGRPAAGAVVVAMPLALKQEERQQAWRLDRASARTGAQGAFRVDGLSAGEVELLAVAPGYVWTRARATMGQTDVVLTLRAGEMIEGTLTAADGKPAAGQWIYVQPTTKEIQEEMQDLQSRAGQALNSMGGLGGLNVTTDAQGAFRFAGLLPGEYQARAQGGPAGVLPPTALKAGQRGVTLRLVAGRRVTGVVVDSTGAPVGPAASAQLWVSAQQGGQWVAGVAAAADGSFELKDLPPGRVTLHTGAQGYQAAKLEVESGTEGVRLILEKPAPPPGPTGK